MESFWSFFHTHQFAVIAVLAVALVAIYFLLKNLVKLALLAILVLILVGGYFYVTAPKKSPEDIARALEKAKNHATSAVEKGRVAYEKGKEIVEKGKQISDDLGKAFGDKTDQKMAPAPGK